MEETNNTVSQQEWRQQIGESLSAARQAKGLSLAQVAEHLKLRVNQIRQIESGDWSNLPAAVFTRGFVRNYAALTEVEDDILPMLDKALPSTAIQIKKSIEPVSDAVQNKPIIRLSTLPVWLKALLLLLVMMACIYLWQNHSAQQNQQQTETQLTQDTQAPALEINHGNVMVVPLPEAQASAAAASDTADTANQASTATTPTAASEPAVQNNTLYINTKYRTFLSVSDAKGETLINQLVPGGSRQQLSGTAPYQIRIGYALGSVVEFNGKTYEMAPYLNGKTATLTVPSP